MNVNKQHALRASFRTLHDNGAALQVAKGEHQNTMSRPCTSRASLKLLQSVQLVKLVPVVGW